MFIGNFGSCIFQVSLWKVLTFDKFNSRTRHRYATHEIINHKPRLESLGADLVEISLQVTLVQDLGVDVELELSNLKAMCTNGAVQPLVIGGVVFGYFVLEEITEEATRWTGSGRRRIINATLKMKEYANDI